MDLTEVHWASLFGLIGWRIWKIRNLYVFQGISWKAEEIVKVSMSWAKQVWATHKKAWSSASAGGVVQNHLGEWVMGFNHSLGTCSIFEANLWGILDGLTLLRDRDQIAKMVQGDSEGINVIVAAPPNLIEGLANDKSK
ncbi:hypothetical protein Golax_017013, partial [Gossypium laxum]|nr:hypothetical protein [Gossypium laxum]